MGHEERGKKVRKCVLRGLWEDEREAGGLCGPRQWGANDTKHGEAATDTDPGFHLLYFLRVSSALFSRGLVRVEEQRGRKATLTPV